MDRVGRQVKERIEDHVWDNVSSESVHHICGHVENLVWNKAMEQVRDRAWNKELY